jgi:hypothetical protein
MAGDGLIHLPRESPAAAAQYETVMSRLAAYRKLNPL